MSTKKLTVSMPEDLADYLRSKPNTSTSGVDRPSRMVANQIRTISKQRIGDVIGRLETDEQRHLDAALRIQLGLG